MNLDTIAYKDTLEKIQYYISDLKAQVTPGKKPERNYTVIQIPKAGKQKCSVSYHIASADGAVNFLIFKSTQTLGIKVYSADRQTLYHYSISQKNGEQVILMQFADGKSFKRNFELDPNINRYVYKDSYEMIPIEDFDSYDISSIDESIGKENLFLVNNYYTTVKENRFVVGCKSAVAHIDNDEKFTFFNLKDHPDLYNLWESKEVMKDSLFFHGLEMETLFSSNNLFKEMNDIVKFYLNLSKQDKNIKPEL